MGISQEAVDLYLSLEKRQKRRGIRRWFRARFWRRRGSFLDQLLLGNSNRHRKRICQQQMEELRILRHVCCYSIQKIAGINRPRIILGNMLPTVAGSNSGCRVSLSETKTDNPALNEFMNALLRNHKHTKRFFGLRRAPVNYEKDICQACRVIQTCQTLKPSRILVLSDADPDVLSLVMSSEFIGNGMDPESILREILLSHDDSTLETETTNLPRVHLTQDGTRIRFPAVRQHPSTSTLQYKPIQSPKHAYMSPISYSLLRKSMR